MSVSNTRRLGLPDVLKRAAGFAALLLTLGVSVQAQTVRDSAGVRIVIYQATDGPKERWRVEPRPSVVIGGDDTAGPAQFFWIAGVLRLRDGSVAVADYGSREIRVFDSAGVHRQTLGGRGPGPGEFPTLWALWLVQDALVGVDASGRAQVFATGGRHLRTIQPLRSASGARIRRLGYLRDGTLIGSYRDRVPEALAGHSTALITLVKQSAGEWQALGRHPAFEQTRRSDGRGAAVVYGPRAHVGVLATRYCVGYSEHYAFRCFDASGTLRTQVVRRGVRSRPVGDADRQIFFEGVDKANPGARGASYRREVRESTVFARRLPPYGRFLGTHGDELWVGPLVPQDETLGTLNPSPLEPTVWSVYTAGGEWLSDVTLPARFRLMDAGLDYVAGVSRDANDVERVVVYELRRK